jgi:hypothetical protein
MQILNLLTSAYKTPLIIWKLCIKDATRTLLVGLLQPKNTSLVLSFDQKHTQKLTLKHVQIKHDIFFLENNIFNADKRSVF